MNLAALQKLVSLGEGLHIEFKQRIPEPERIAKEVIAFANTKGGKLIVGVEDSGRLCGVKDAEEELYAFQEALLQCCTPPIALQFEMIQIRPRRDVLIVHIPNSTAKPHFLVEESGQKTAYLRVEDKSIEASKEATRLMRFEHETQDVCFEFGEKERILMEYLERYERISIAQFARIAQIHRKQAAQTLFILTKAKILHLIPKEEADEYRLNTNRTAL